MTNTIHRVTVTLTTALSEPDPEKAKQSVLEDIQAMPVTEEEFGRG